MRGLAIALPYSINKHVFLGELTLSDVCYLSHLYLLISMPSYSLPPYQWEKLPHCICATEKSREESYFHMSDALSVLKTSCNKLSFPLHLLFRSEAQEEKLTYISFLIWEPWSLTGLTCSLDVSCSDEFIFHCIFYNGFTVSEILCLTHRTIDFSLLFQ